MKHRIFGKTGLEISALGFGCMRFPVLGGNKTRIDEDQAIRMVRQAIDDGVNYFDTAYPYHGESFSVAGSSEPFLARALKDGYREKIFLATKLPCWLVDSREDMDRILEEQLERLETEQVDFYLLHALNRTTWPRMVKNGVIDFLESALASGKIKYAGFSYHDELELFKEVVDAFDWSMCQIMYNYYDVDFQAGKEGLSYAAQKGIAVVAMEPLRGGSLVTGLPAEANSILLEKAPERSNVEWAFRWLWDQPEVSVVLSGMSSMEQVTENIELANDVSQAPWDQGGQVAIEQVTKVIKKLQRVPCTTCNYCMPCPEGVNIPRNFSLCNDHHMLNDPSASGRYIGLLSESERASNCVQCGKCEPQCPQQIPIMKELEHVAELFGN